MPLFSDNPFDNLDPSLFKKYILGNWQLVLKHDWPVLTCASQGNNLCYVESKTKDKEGYCQKCKDQFNDNTTLEVECIDCGKCLCENCFDKHNCLIPIDKPLNDSKIDYPVETASVFRCPSCNRGVNEHNSPDCTRPWNHVGFNGIDWGDSSLR
jgi:hypothetical protein